MYRFDTNRIKKTKLREAQFVSRIEPDGTYERICGRRGEALKEEQVRGRQMIQSSGDLTVLTSPSVFYVIIDLDACGRFPRVLLATDFVPPQ